MFWPEISFGLLEFLLVLLLALAAVAAPIALKIEGRRHRILKGRAHNGSASSGTIDHKGGK